MSIEDAINREGNPVAERSRPNILVFLTDDHGQWAAGCYGNRALHTPSMDWLALTGARCENAFTPCPVCSPARASFWTGQFPSAHGVHDHLGNRDHPGITGQTNLAERLQTEGYRTGLSGKWHGHATGAQRQPGFDYWFSQWGGTNAKFGNQPFSENGERREFYGHQAPIVTDAAIRFLRESRDDAPFFLFVGYTETHSPFSTLPERLAAPHRADCFDDVPREGFSGCHGRPKTAAPDDEAAWREQLVQYYAAVEALDEQIGRILDELEATGQLHNTLIVYTSDHGHMNGQHGLLCKGNATVPQNFIEESIRIPMLLRQPDLVREGTEVNEPVDHCDLHATLLASAGAKANSSAPGKSLLPLLKGEEVVWRDFQLGEYGNARMIRTSLGEKLIKRWPGPNGQFRDEFYDLKSDPRETTNRIDDPEWQARIAELSEKLDSEFAQLERPGCSGIEAVFRDLFNPQEPWKQVVNPTAS